MSTTNTPLSMLPAIKPGCFLVLYGEQGAGKTRMAQRIANHRGKFQVITPQHLHDSGMLAEALCESPSTLIFEDEGLEMGDLALFKALVTASYLYLRPPYKKHLVKLAVPPVIVCTQDARNYTEVRRAQLFLVRKD
jgi:hypothetical protein